MTKQKTIGSWIAGIGQLLLVAIVAICLFDVAGLSSRGELLVPLTGYLIAIFTGVAMQFVGAAVPNMRFGNDTNPKGGQKKPTIQAQPANKTTGN